jgi:rRNA maturation protein Nop10
MDKGYARGVGAGIVLNGTISKASTILINKDINSTFSNCVFTNNYTPDVGGCSGAGIYAVHSEYTSTSIEDSSFSFNRGCYGSSVFITVWTDIMYQIPPNKIVNSVFTNQTRGADLYFLNTSVSAEHIVIRNSSAQGLYFNNSFNNVVKSSVISGIQIPCSCFYSEGNHDGVWCTNGGFDMTDSSTYLNLVDITCTNCLVEGQWTGAECAVGSCIRYRDAENELFTVQRDVCSVCGGNGTSCLGCDGLVWSHKENDICGVCGGDTSTCVPCFNKTFDACGVCEGDGSTCAEIEAQSNNMGTILGAAIGAGGGFILMVALLIFLFLRRRSRAEKIRESQAEMTNYSGMGSSRVSTNYGQWGTGTCFPIFSSNRKKPLLPIVREGRLHLLQWISTILIIRKSNLKSKLGKGKKCYYVFLQFKFIWNSLEMYLEIVACCRY